MRKTVAIIIFTINKKWRTNEVRCVTQYLEILDTRINTLSFSFISPFQCKANRFNKEWRFVALCSGSGGHKKSITLFSDVLFHALHYAFLLISITKCTCYNWNPEYRNHDVQVHLPQGNHHKHPLQRTWKSELHRTWECQLP